jgi:hypothetical protein
VISDQWITKELSVVAVPNKGSRKLQFRRPPPEVRARVNAQIAWLHQVITESRVAASQHVTFGLFGSSIAAIWLFGLLTDQTAFFVDEDPSRHHAKLFGRPVLRPEEVPPGSCVYLPLIPKVARAVAKRLARPAVHFHIPPEIVVQERLTDLA